MPWSTSWLIVTKTCHQAALAAKGGSYLCQTGSITVLAMAELTYERLPAKDVSDSTGSVEQSPWCRLYAQSQTSYTDVDPESFDLSVSSKSLLHLVADSVL